MGAKFSMTRVHLSFRPMRTLVLYFTLIPICISFFTGASVNASNAKQSSHEFEPFCNDHSEFTVKPSSNPDVKSGASTAWNVNSQPFNPSKNTKTSQAHQIPRLNQMSYPNQMYNFNQMPHPNQMPHNQMPHNQMLQYNQMSQFNQMYHFNQMPQYNQMPHNQMLQYNQMPQYNQMSQFNQMPMQPNHKMHFKNNDLRGTRQYHVLPETDDSSSSYHRSSNKDFQSEAPKDDDDLVSKQLKNTGKKNTCPTNSRIINEIDDGSNFTTPAKSKIKKKGHSEPIQEPSISNDDLTTSQRKTDSSSFWANFDGTVDSSKKQKFNLATAISNSDLTASQQKTDIDSIWRSFDEKKDLSRKSKKPSLTATRKCPISYYYIERVFRNNTDTRGYASRVDVPLSNVSEAIRKDCNDLYDIYLENLDKDGIVDIQGRIKSKELELECVIDLKDNTASYMTILRKGQPWLSIHLAQGANFVKPDDSDCSDSSDESDLKSTSPSNDSPLSDSPPLLKKSKVVVSPSNQSKIDRPRWSKEEMDKLMVEKTHLEYCYKPVSTYNSTDDLFVARCHLVPFAWCSNMINTYSMTNSYLGLFKFDKIYSRLETLLNGIVLNNAGTGAKVYVITAIEDYDAIEPCKKEKSKSKSAGPLHYPSSLYSFAIIKNVGYGGEDNVLAFKVNKHVYVQPSHVLELWDKPMRSKDGLPIFIKPEKLCSNGDCGGITITIPSEVLSLLTNPPTMTTKDMIRIRSKIKQATVDHFQGIFSNPFRFLQNVFNSLGISFSSIYHVDYFINQDKKKFFARAKNELNNFFSLELLKTFVKETLKEKNFQQWNEILCKANFSFWSYLLDYDVHKWSIENDPNMMGSKDIFEEIEAIIYGGSDINGPIPKHYYPLLTKLVLYYLKLDKNYEEAVSMAIELAEPSYPFSIASIMPTAKSDLLASIKRKMWGNYLQHCFRISENPSSSDDHFMFNLNGLPDFDTCDLKNLTYKYFREHAPHGYYVSKKVFLQH